MILGAVAILSIIHSYGTALVAPPLIAPQSMAGVDHDKSRDFPARPALPSRP